MPKIVLCEPHWEAAVLTVAGVLRFEGLELGLLAGRAGLGREVSWAHAIEVADPVPWLRGGELVLTIGLGLPADEPGRRAYVRRLAEAGAAGLGFAAEVLDALPPEVLDEAEACELPVVGVLGTTPFIAVSQAVARWHAEAALRAERHAIAVQEAIARAALRSGDRGILAELAKGVGGEALLLDVEGRPRAAHPAGERPWHGRARDLVAGMAGPAQAAGAEERDGRYLVVHSIGLSGHPRGWLAVDSPAGDPAHQRLLVSHAAVLLGMTLLGIRALRRTLHEQRARLLPAVAEPDASLLPEPPFEVVVFALAVDDPLAAVLDAIADVAGKTDQERLLLTPCSGGLAAVLPAAAGLGARIRARAAELTGVAVGCGASIAVDVAGIPAAIRRAADVAPADSSYVDAEEASSWGLLREALRPAALAPFTTAVLGSLREHDRRTGSELVPTLRCYLDADGNLETTARELGVHRNTVRTRLRTAERVSRRRLDRPRDRLELWLALAAEDL
ncbi:PucR family transcriptional regulator [Amycolatopsis orientalis]|uniref:PucR family transcriptional regulator n=1 Tax=Amycolatopsis orientalis TaxID=31958 RepID=UPI0006855290|nr:PucR family transcriptional regulator [Amycolatopsis orientalis]